MAHVTIIIEKLGIEFTRQISDKLAKKIYQFAQPTKAEKKALEQETKKETHTSGLAIVEPKAD